MPADKPDSRAATLCSLYACQQAAGSRQQGLTKPRVSGQAAQRVTRHHSSHAVGHQHEAEGPLLSLLGPSHPATMQLLQVPDAVQHKVCLVVLH